MNEFQTLLLAVEVARQAGWAAEQWPGKLVPGDVVEGVWGELTPDHRSTLLASDPTTRSMAIRWIAARVAQQEIVMLEHFSGVVTYSISEVWQLLNRGILHKDRRDLSGETLDAWMDMRWAMGGIGHSDWNALNRAFFWGCEGVPGVGRAVDALTLKLNRKRFVNG